MATYRSNGYTEYPNNPMYSGGKKLRNISFDATITAAAAADGDVYILGGAMGVDDRVAGIVGATPALTSSDDNDLGFFKKDRDGDFVAIDADALWDGVDLTSALTYRELLFTLNTSLDRNDSIGTLLGLNSDEEPAGGIYLGLTINTKTTAVSSVLALEVLVEEATTK